MPARLFGAAVVVLLPVIATALAGCGSSSRPVARSTIPTAPTNNLLVVAPATVSGVRITGSLTLDTVGATSQLTATATFSDGTTKDVTSEVRWGTSDPDVLTITANGLITAVQLGSTSIFAAYQGRNDTKSVTITPPGTYIAVGRVREPGASGVPGVRVTDLVSGRSATSGSEGQFTLGALSQGARLRFQKDGYEQPADVEVPMNGAVPDTPVQKIIRLSAGEKAQPSPFAPHDLQYTIGSQRCQPCRRIRVLVGSRGTLEVKATTARDSVLILPNGQTVASDAGAVTAEIPVSAAGELVMYFGLPGTTLQNYLAFTIEAVLR